MATIPASIQNYVAWIESYPDTLYWIRMKKRVRELATSPQMLGVWATLEKTAPGNAKAFMVCAAIASQNYDKARRENLDLKGKITRTRKLISDLNKELLGLKFVEGMPSAFLDIDEILRRIESPIITSGPEDFGWTEAKEKLLGEPIATLSPDRPKQAMVEYWWSLAPNIVQVLEELKFWLGNFKPPQPNRVTAALAKRQSNHKGEFVRALATQLAMNQFDIRRGNIRFAISAAVNTVCDDKDKDYSPDQVAKALGIKKEYFPKR